MRLRTLEAFWLLKNGLLYTYPMLLKSVETDMIVVGGGITGALISHALMEEGYKTLLIDKKDIGQGSTAATTAMLQYEIDEPLQKLAKMIGEENGAYCYQEGIKAIHDLKKLTQTYPIDGNFKTKQSLYIAHNNAARKELEKEFVLRDKHKLGVQWLEEKQILHDYGIKAEVVFYQKPLQALMHIAWRTSLYR